MSWSEDDWGKPFFPTRFGSPQVTTAMVGVASQQERLAVVSKDAPLRETVLTKPNRVVAASAPLRIAVKSNL